MAKKKKKIERGYATISTSKKEPIAANVNDESIQELEIPTRNDESMAVPDNDIDQTKDADRLLKWQVDYDYKLYDQKRVKLEANDAVPYFQVINETEALELLSGLEEDAQMGSSDEMNKTFLMMDKLGFDRDIIKACLRNSAGDLNSAIGWAYLNYQSLDLPVWLSRENVKIVAAGESDGDVDRVIGANETKNDLKSDFRIHEADNTKLPVAKETLKGGVDKDMQQRILASLEWMDSDNDDVEVQDKEQEKTKDVDDYATMYIQYLKFKNTAASAKVKGDNLLKKSASNSAHKLMQKIIQVKSKMDLDQLKRAEDMIDAWVVKDAAVNKNDCVAEAEDSLQDDELGLDILEKSAEEANNSESKTIFIHDLSWKGWSGSSPSFWLSDFIRRNFPKSKISISLFPKTVAYRAKLSLISDGESKEYIMAEDELVMAKSDAKEYIALKTLFFLSPEAQIRNSVAPPFRDLWANWCEEAARALKQESDTLDEDRISFIESLLVNEVFFSEF